MNAIPVNAENPTVEERSAEITLGGQQYELVLTTLATKLIARRYGGLENLGEKLSNTEHFEDALDEIEPLAPGRQACATDRGNGRAALHAV